MFRVTSSHSFPFSPVYPARLITKGDSSGMFPFMSTLVEAFTDMRRQSTGEVFGKRAKHLSKELSLRGGIVDVFGNGDEGHIMLREDAQGFKSYSLVSRPPVESMDDNRIKTTSLGILK